MEYLVEPIGAEFSANALTRLAQNFTRRAAQGYKLQFVFQASQPGCLGIGQPTITYLAVYVKEQHPATSPTASVGAESAAMLQRIDRDQPEVVAGGNIESSQIADTIRVELEATRSEFHEMLESVSQRGWFATSENPGWTNGQVLFHMTLGLALVLPLVAIMRLFVALPRSWSRGFASLLNFATPLFNWVNGLGTRFGARLYNWRTLGSKYDHVHTAVVRKLQSIRADEWERGMHYPVKWDSRFSDYMTVERLFHHPTSHLKHHRAQIRAS